ncbi:MAG: hypothetical protein NC819_00805 [Candidatus Omnitrophica bacterium]|nr:hypothetical protein [Candidatus Omnitrophota bacterium]
MKLAWKQITMALVVGFLLGGGFGLWMARQQVPSWARYTPEQKKEQMLQEFARELKLTDSQKEQIKRILDSSVDQMEFVRSEMRQKFQAVRSDMKAQIDPLLTGEQRELFKKIEAKWEARKKK